MNQLGHVTRFLPYQHFFVQQLELRYTVKHLRNYLKGSEECLYAPNLYATMLHKNNPDKVEIF